MKPSQSDYEDYLFCVFSSERSALVDRVQTDGSQQQHFRYINTFIIVNTGIHSRFISSMAHIHGSSSDVMNRLSVSEKQLQDLKTENTGELFFIQTTC